MFERIKYLWCGVVHGGGTIKRDCYQRVNWQCSKCGRWAMPVDRQTEKLITDHAIDQRLKDQHHD